MRRYLVPVIPTKVGIHLSTGTCLEMDPGFRREDNVMGQNGGTLYLGDGVRE